MAHERSLHDQHGRVTMDMLFGAIVFGVVGAAIGYYWGTTASLAVATTVGLAFGFVIGLLGGRRFFIAIICHLISPDCVYYSSLY